jgi:hypothetical protein
MSPDNPYFVDRDAMPAPAPIGYSASFSFTAFEAASPNTPKPGTSLDVEFANLHTSVASTILALADIRRADGGVTNGRVTWDSLDSATQKLFVTFKPRGLWVTGASYALGDMVRSPDTNGTYIAGVAHTAGVWATDKAANLWLVIAPTDTIVTAGVFTSGTFSTSLTATGPATFIGTVGVSGAAATVRPLQFQTAGVPRWQLDTNATAETGANAGSDLELWSYSDAGAALFKTLTVNRATGLMTISGPVTFTGAVSMSGVNGVPQTGMRNRLINGSMAIDQRNEGASQTITPAVTYSVDRWTVYPTGASVTGQRVAGSNQSQYRYRITGAAAVSSIVYGQRIEAANCYDMNGTTASLSVDLANSLLTTVTWTASYASATDNFSSVVQFATGTFTVSSTVARYIASVSVPAIATTGIQIALSVGAQLSGTWTIGDAQFEPGAVANSMERRPFGVELALCQRYYAVVKAWWVGDTVAAGVYASSFQFKVDMRVPPAMTLLTASGAANGGLGARSVAALSRGYAFWSVTATTTANAAGLNDDYSASAEL